MDWFMVFMPLTPDMNQEDPSAAKVKVDPTTKFAVSNWMGYSNTKAMLYNAGEHGHIFFAGKFKPFKNKDSCRCLLSISSMDSLQVHSLSRRCRTKSISPPMATTGLWLLLVLDGNRSTGLSGTSLPPRIPS